MKNDGGPAFPATDSAIIGKGDEAVIVPGQFGMSLRDYFAAHAPAMPEEYVKADKFYSGEGHLQVFGIVERRSKWAYEYADAMLAEREKS